MATRRRKVEEESARRRLACLQDFVVNSRNQSESAYEAALQGLVTLLSKADGPTVRWYFDQMMGTPRTTVEIFVHDPEVYKVLGGLLPKYLDSETRCRELLTELRESVGRTG